MTRMTLSVEELEYRHDGRTTTAIARDLSEENGAALGLIPVGDRSTLAHLTGVGVARCRPGDHYEMETGRQIAAARAIMDLMIQVEAALTNGVETEAQHLVRVAGETVAASLQTIVESFNAAMAAAGVEGAIVVEDDR